MPDATAVAGDWLTAVASFRHGPYWGAALENLPQDRRILIVGPGSKDPQHYLTEALRLFLLDIGFAPSVLDEDLDVHAHRQTAQFFPWVVALPVSVGACVEVLDLATILEVQ